MNIQRTRLVRFWILVGSIGLMAESIFEPDSMALWLRWRTSSPLPLPLSANLSTWLGWFSFTAIAVSLLVWRGTGPKRLVSFLDNELFGSAVTRLAAAIIFIVALRSVAIRPEYRPTVAERPGHLIWARHEVIDDYLNRNFTVDGAEMAGVSLASAEAPSSKARALLRALEDRQVLQRIGRYSEHPDVGLVDQLQRALIRLDSPPNEELMNGWRDLFLNGIRKDFFAGTEGGTPFVLAKGLLKLSQFSEGEFDLHLETLEGQPEVGTSCKLIIESQSERSRVEDRRDVVIFALGPVLRRVESSPRDGRVIPMECVALFDL